MPHKGGDPLELEKCEMNPVCRPEPVKKVVPQSFAPQKVLKRGEIPKKAFPF